MWKRSRGENGNSMLAWENKAIYKGAEQETEVSLLQFLWEEMDHPHEGLAVEEH